MKRRIKQDLPLDIFIYVVLIFLTIVTFYPVWYVIVSSFSNSVDIVKYPGIVIWPKRFSTGAYQMVFQHALLVSGLKNSVKLLLISLPINVIMTLLCGYFLACRGVLFKKPIVALFMFTMFFGGGLIPNYLNIKSLGLMDSIWALVLPGSLSLYNAIVCKTAIEAIPDSLSESAFIDGANDFQIIFKIILPLIKPTLAVLLLYYGVGHWNSWFPASIYIKDKTLHPIQNVLREVLQTNAEIEGSQALGDNYSQYAETIKYAAIVISTVPIMCIYPFLQKYFTKGVMIGAVKG